MNSSVKPSRIFLSPPHMGDMERSLVMEAFESNYIAPTGPMVAAFENDFSEIVQVPNAVALSSGTAAIHLALRSIGVGSSDVVIASTLTFIGSVSPILFQSGVPIFIDADPDTWNMDTNLLAEAVDHCLSHGVVPKAVIPTELYGQCIDLDKIVSVCVPHDIPVVVDAAEALGATYKGSPARGGAKAAVFSFNGNKIITTSGGGMLVSHDKELIDHARKLSEQAREPFPHYEHTELGYNYRMSNILAAIGRGQLMVLKDRVEKKRWIFEYYQKAFEQINGIEFMPEASYGRSNRWLSVILITPEIFGSDRETVHLALETENIESRPVWKPMHLQPLFEIVNKGAGFDHFASQIKTFGTSKKHPALKFGGGIAEDFYSKGLCLPSGTALTQSDLDRIISIILSCSKASSYQN